MYTARISTTIATDQISRCVSPRLNEVKVLAKSIAAIAKFARFTQAFYTKTTKPSVLCYTRIISDHHKRFSRKLLMCVRVLWEHFNFEKSSFLGRSVCEKCGIIKERLAREDRGNPPTLFFFLSSFCISFSIHCAGKSRNLLLIMHRKAAKKGDEEVYQVYRERRCEPQHAHIETRRQARQEAAEKTISHSKAAQKKKANHADEKNSSVVKVSIFNFCTKRSK